jgi:hypothetical protein
MLKKWHESRPFTFEAVFIFLFLTIPILDEIYTVPRMKPVCNGQIGEEQVKMCTDWIKTKEKVHVPKASNPLGGLYRDTPSDIQRQWEREIGTFGSPVPKK